MATVMPEGNGVDQHQRKSLAESALVYSKRLAADPNDVTALHRLGMLRYAQGRDLEAAVLLGAAAKRDTDSVEISLDYGLVLKELGRMEEALAAVDNARACAPGNPRPLYERGKILRRLDRFEEALACLDAAIALDPTYALAISKRGHVLTNLEREREALEWHERALAIDANLRPAHVQAAYAHFRLGEFVAGWNHYEWRIRPLGSDSRYGMKPRSYHALPHWNGERMTGTLLVWGEQALGEEILFASMLRDVLPLASHIVVEIAPRLVPLFTRAFPGVTVIPRSTTPYPGVVDAQIAIGSLGKYFRPSWDAFVAARRPFLAADEARTHQLRGELGSPGTAVIGLSWVSRAPVAGRGRTAALQDFASLFRLPACSFVDLQYGDTSAERAGAARDLGVVVDRIASVDTMNDIDGLAALMSTCDAVVTVANTNAHLAGALGRPTWVLVPFGSSRLWHWFKDRADSPWYAGMRVIYQKRDEPWGDVVSSVAQDVAAFLGRSSSRPEESRP